MYALSIFLLVINVWAGVLAFDALKRAEKRTKGLYFPTAAVHKSGNALWTLAGMNAGIPFSSMVGSMVFWNQHLIIASILFTMNFFAFAVCIERYVDAEIEKRLL